MKDIYPHEGEPINVERLSFAPEDAALAVGAVSYYVSSSTRTLEANWDSEGYHGMVAGVDSALEDLGGLAAFVVHGNDLATKLAAHHADPSQPVELTDSDIEMMGYSLFRFGNDGCRYAYRALQHEAVWTGSTESQEKEFDVIELRQRQSKKIFMSLEPLAQAKGLSWMEWSSGSASN